MDTPTVPSPVLRRYRFQEWLVGFDGATRRRLVRELQAELGISRVTMYRWLEMLADSTNDIPYGAVVLISRKLGKDPLAALTEAPTAQAA